jgi:lipid A 3-O-deacylase
LHAQPSRRGLFTFSALLAGILFTLAPSARAQLAGNPTPPSENVIRDPAVYATDPNATTGDDWVHSSLKFKAINLGILGGGGTGLGKSDNTQFAYLGGRAGIVLTNEHLPGLLRGNFEWDVDVLPLYAVLPPNGGVYGGSIRPLIWKWNFTHGRKIAPYFAAEGGIVFTRSNVPPGDTSQINFTPGAAFGANFFLKNRRSFFLEGNVGHLSSASLGDHNPGYNVTFMISGGFSFFKRTM